MMRIATPETVWPRHFFNRLNKMQTRASKIKNGLPINEAKNDEIPDSDPLAPPGVASVPQQTAQIAGGLLIPEWARKTTAEIPEWVKVSFLGFICMGFFYTS